MEDPKVLLFDELATIFKKHGFRLYMVGGTSRDFLLGLPLNDFDFATDATPEEMRSFLKDANYRYAEYGTVVITQNAHKVQVTTLRTEEGYGDYRHPRKVTFVKKIEDDYMRRDFTVNALYLDEDYKVYDFASGLKDLYERKLRAIGEPIRRFQEDPLRMIRALRFMARFNFEAEDTLSDALYQCAPLITNLNPDKIKEERRKVKKEHLSRFETLYTKYKF